MREDSGVLTKEQSHVLTKEGTRLFIKEQAGELIKERSRGLIKEQSHMFMKDRAWVEINLQNLEHNVKVLQERLPQGCELMAVVKANAYGHGDVEIASYLNKIKVHSLAVATIEEGIALRQAGIRGEILILGYTAAEWAKELYQYQLTQTAVDVQHAQELNRYGKAIKIHLKIDTGMNRLGEDYRHVNAIASVFQCKGLKVTGMFSHMSVSDSREEGDIAFSYSQQEHFLTLIESLKERGIAVPKLHLQSSYGLMNYPDLRYGYARIGIALYGVYSTIPGKGQGLFNLRPVLALKSRVVLLKSIGEGESVGYGRAYQSEKETKLAVVSIGYADGYPRSLSGGNCEVLIRGYRAPIVGRICMDQLMVDVTGLPQVERGDTVTLIGRDGKEEIRAEELAQKAGTISNELLSRLGGRLSRRSCPIGKMGN